MKWNLSRVIILQFTRFQQGLRVFCQSTSLDSGLKKHNFCNFHSIVVYYIKIELRAAAVSRNKFY